MQNTKDAIKNRMLHYASRLWGYPGAVSEDSFDPVLGMLMGACASEIEKIGKESSLSHARLIEAIAQLIVPEINTRALPAHGIAHIPSSNLEDHIDINTNFSCEKEIAYESDKQKSIKNFTFVPSIDTHIHKAQVKYILSKNIYKQTEGRYKEIVAPAKYGKRFDESAVFLGIENVDKLKTMSDLILFFDLEESESKKNSFFSNLQYAQFSLNGKALETSQGFQTSSQNDSVIKGILNKNRLMDQHQEEINRFYSPYFIKIKKLEDLTESYATYPEELQGFYEEEDLENIEPAIFWVKISFSSIISAESLSHLACHLNCFPIINKKRIKESFLLQSDLNIRPLICENFFYDMESVIDSGGTSYDKVDFLLNKTRETDKVSLKQYVLRSTGVGRLDGRQAEDMLCDLLDTLREERIAFSVFGKDNLQGDVTALDMQMNLLRNKMKRGANPEYGVNYIMIMNDDNSQNTNLHLSYWENDGEFGNGIKKGNSLKIGGESLLVGRNAVMMTVSQGGRNHLKGEERAQAFKGAYLTKNRIVTMNDVREYLLSLLGKKIDGVDVKKGVMISPNKNEGFIRVIEVELELNTTYLSFDHEQDEIAFRTWIAQQLEEASASLHTFKVSIK